ncbi:MAG: type I methionyl aminopeptidase [Oscillospiraceae bacterium]|jgi:methionyl aminopeptidase|nr:type I methionyl aminopeptidase [Oscillospiraceae bacterium]
MIALKTARELALMREAGKIAAEALRLVGEAVRPGVTTAQLNQIAHRAITRHGAVPTFLGYNGFPAAACISVNDEIIHGIPSARRVLREGDLVSVDLGATYQGYVGDTAASFAAGVLSPEARRLSDTTRESLFQGIGAAVAGGKLGDIGAAVQRHCEAQGYSLVREYTGHGVGRALHEDPAVPNVGLPGHGIRLKPGMVLAIEPMVNQGRMEIRTMPDKWTIKTRDGKLSAHFEHTVAITPDGPVILTMGES